MARLFLSYAREDSARASKIAQAFQAEGYEVWWDQKIPAGLTWREFIPERIRQSSAVVVLWTRTSIRSDWVGEEASLARSQRKLLPVKLDDVEPPFGFREVEAADLIGWNCERRSPGWKNLMAGVRRLAGGQAPISAPTGHAPPRAPGPRLNVIALGVAAALLATLAVWGSNERGGAPRTQTQANASEASEQARLAPFDVRPLSEQVREAVLSARAAAEQGRAMAERARAMQRRAHAVAALARANDARGETVAFPNGDTWAGQRRRPSEAALGVYTLASGMRLSGQFRVDSTGARLTGDPYVRELRDGARFFGRTADGAHWTGPGLYEFADGGWHAGVWTIESPETFGVRLFADGRRYEGQFRHVHRANYDMDQHGLGVLWSADGRVIQAGRWRENAFVGQ